MQPELYNELMTMNTIARLHSDDHKLLAEIGKKSLLESHGSSAEESVMEAYVNSNFSLQACKAELDDPENIFHVIYHKGRPAGYSKIIFNAALPGIASPHITKLERLYLLKEFYGLKLGLELFRFNVNLSKQNSQTGMWLTVWSKNHRAINFYNASGFKVMGEGSFKLTETHANPTYEMFLQYPD